MDDNKTKSEIAYLKKELAKVNKELAKSKACEVKRKSDLEEVKATLRKERKKKDVKQINLSEEQERLISTLLPGILTPNS